MAAKPNTPVSVITPPASGVLTKVVQIVRTDTTAFEAFGIPQGAVIVGAYVLGATASDAVTTATIKLNVKGSTSGEFINAFSVKTNGQGYFAVGATAGSYMGTQLAADTIVTAIYAETGTASTTGGPWLAKVEYYIPPSGFSY